ncbi:MAG TPA: hypothetical protein VKA21_07985 [Candidatus Binatia bacterium]|nr:hypothetical protein [Candidatus Binatia bacterium]
MIGAGELVLLAALVAVLYAALSPLRRWLAARIARALGRRLPRRSGRVVVLDRRRDGTFARGDGDDG